MPISATWLRSRHCIWTISTDNFKIDRVVASGVSVEVPHPTPSHRRGYYGCRARRERKVRMSEIQTRKTPQETLVVIREAQAIDAAVIAALYWSLVQDVHINVRPERLQAIAADANTY